MIMLLLIALGKVFNVRGMIKKDPMNGVYLMGTLLFVGVMLFSFYCEFVYGVHNPIASH